MTNRRNFLKNASLLTAGGLLAGKAGIAKATSTTTSSTMANKKLGLQIYSLQGELFDDLPKRMREVREMGFVDLELAGYKDGKIRNVDMMEFKKMADDAGLKIVSSHVDPPGESQYGLMLDYHKDKMPQVNDFWKKAADDHAKIGCPYLLQSTMPTCKSHERAALLCDFFNEAGKIVKAAGIEYGYHNHHMEFERLVRPEDIGKEKNPWTIPGDQIIDLFIAGTDPNLVSFEVDVYWTARGGSDPVEFIAKNANRVKLLHIKDTKILGQSGLLNFHNIFDQMYANGIKTFFVEMEPLRNDTRTQFEGVKECADFLQNASFVR